MEKDSITAADGDAGRFPAVLDHVQPRVRRAALRLAITLGHRQVLRLGCSRLIINEPTLMKGMQETTSDFRIQKYAIMVAESMVTHAPVRALMFALS